MATVVLGVLIAGGVAFALRRVYRNHKTGQSDCCGTSTCSGGCSGCHKD